MNDPSDMIHDPDYRPNVGIMLINKNHQVLTGEVCHDDGKWMMPQGGIDSGETPLQAVQRELLEETSIDFDDTRLIREHEEWLSYEFEQPLEKDGILYKGQRQKWFLLEYNGNLPDPEKTRDREFVRFRWADPTWLVERTTRFKIRVYQSIFVAFERYFP